MSVPHSTTPTSAMPTVTASEQPMHAVEAGERGPQGDAKEPDDAKNAAEDKSRRYLTAHDSPPVLELHFAQRDRPDHEGRGLGAGVAAARDDERHEQRHHHGLGDFLLEEAHCGGGEHLTQEQGGQPSRAFSNHAAERDGDVGLIERLRAADPLNVFRGRGLRDVEDVVNGDNADEDAGRIGDRKRGAVLAAKHRDGGLLVVGRLQGDESPVHQVGHPVRRATSAESPECGCRRSSMFCSSTT